MTGQAGSSFRVPRAALRVVEWARAAVPLYRELYAGLPPVASAHEFRRLPVLTAARLRATPLAEQVDDLNDVLRTFTPYLLQSAVLPAAIVADRDDTDTAFEECRDAFALLGVRAGARVVVVCDPEQRFFGAELAERLGYFGVQAHVVMYHGRDTASALIATLRPDHIVAGPALPGVRPTITIRAAARADATGSISIPQSAVSVPHSADVYLVPEAGFVAVRPAGETSYRPLAGRYLIEAERDGRLLLTALRRYHQPLIRYELADRGRIVHGRLHLDEVAP